MPLKEFVQEHLNDAIDLHRHHARNVTKEFTKPKDQRNYNEIITDIEQMGISERFLYRPISSQTR